jgi:hypothetical protein
MKRKSIPFLALLLMFSLMTSVALAGNPHFIKSATSATQVGNTLVVNFKEAGLASGSVETVQVSALGTATFQCINGGGKNPSAANKTTVSSQLSNSGTFSADRSGNIVGSLTLNAPGPGGFSCPPGQTLSGPLDVSFTNIVVSDLTSGATIRL